MGAKQGAFICRSGIAASGGVPEERFQEFHEWNYRIFVAALKNRSDEEELHFTTDLINENFSNYSSWHNCSVILSHLLEKRAQESFSKEKVLTLYTKLFLLTRMIKVDGFIIFGFLSKQLKWRILCWFLPGHLMVLILMYQQMVSWILVLRLLSQVSLGHSQGIVSLSGFHHSHPTHFEFTVLIQPHGSQHAEMKSAEMISWGDENFHTGETHLLEPTQIKIFDQLRNSEVNESTASKWSAETIVNEIALFRELLSEINCKIGKLMLARLLTAHDAMMSYDKTPETCKMVHSEEVKNYIVIL
ncbi:Geranylgeranyl transferase type-2 subunit alpha 1 [Camellia lanceoleosa]|uniref:Geranylgeranyl transferase type-2 subunit alpha 1 n=1 Tax=Camellia lanceoleosa TaxID=1840588 RepID=A0ACC0G2V7_9ERIC|nr:Geranylgeranyl transferase type-2 subunit alpha 1 [Camellia lanceoleosa]